MRHRSLCAALPAAVLAASCAVAGDPQKPSGGIEAQPPRLPAKVPSSAPPQGKLVTAEVPPDLIEKMRADLAQRVGIAASAAKVVRAEAIDWPNGALGCAEPGKMYTQAIVPGYVVEFEHEGKTYSYHAAKTGQFTLCDRAQRARGADAR
ncbi:MAG TPA: hypothetical protein VFS52_09325 [Steroidobacteraceae bacterium]|jgi:hypothetical protein|nr:hypothetical protein [Steroidobacteraceae bacterium]